MTPKTGQNQPQFRGISAKIQHPEVLSILRAVAVVGVSVARREVHIGIGVHGKSFIHLLAVAAMRHPACDETQSVARSPSGM